MGPGPPPWGLGLSAGPGERRAPAASVRATTAAAMGSWTVRRVPVKEKGGGKSWVVDTHILAKLLHSLPKQSCHTPCQSSRYSVLNIESPSILYKAPAKAY